MSTDDVCHLLSLVGRMIDGETEVDLMEIWSYLNYILLEDETNETV